MCRQDLALLRDQEMHQVKAKFWRTVLAAAALAIVFCFCLLSRRRSPPAMVSQHITLNTGALIPSIGLGVFLATPGKEAYNAVASALRLGYRHVDTAKYYNNEKDVGKAVRESGLRREEVFVTSKIWLTDFGYKRTQKAIRDCLKTMGFPTLDLMLMHAPGPAEIRAETWRALEEAHHEGLLTSIGVSNFGIHHIEKLLQTAKVVPAVNQVELTPFLQRTELVDYCRSKGIAMQAYSPLGKASRDVLHNATVSSVAKKNGVTNAQVLIRWGLQQGYVSLPKSANASRQAENLDAFKFELGDEDMQHLNKLERYLVTAWDPVSQED